MKKNVFNLLLFATMLFALSTNINAQTKRTQVRKTTTMAKKTTAKKVTATAAKPCPQMVDMGLSVKWSNIDLGATTTQSAGSLYFVSEDVSKACGEGWRLPTLDEFKELLDNTDKLVVESNGKPTCIKLTSKKNGAKLYFYLPESIMANDGSLRTNPIRMGGNTFYMLNEHVEPGRLSGKRLQGFCVMDFRNSKGQIQSTLNKAGLTNMKFSEWPKEMVDKVTKEIGQNAFFSDYLDWLGAAPNSDVNIDMKAAIRPVYSVNDDE